MALALAIDHVKLRLASVAIVYQSHERWPFHPSHFSQNSPVNIAVLDSSFNPPTSAHRALLNASNPSSSPYDAKLLLLSVRNADKSLNSDDATFVQRLEMMSLLAKDTQFPNIAVAIIDQPTFIAKSSILRQFLRNHISHVVSNPNHNISTQLSFLIGFDTLERILSPRYYSSEEEMSRSLRSFLSQDGDDSRLVCARRPNLLTASDSESLTLAAAKEFIDSQRLVLIDIGDTEQPLSSSNIRQQIAAGVPAWTDATIPSLAQYILNNKLYHP
jgi:nicotinamide-nucleotide adenylyltransferase